MHDLDNSEYGIDDIDHFEIIGVQFSNGSKFKLTSDPQVLGVLKIRKEFNFRPLTAGIGLDINKNIGESRPVAYCMV